jgi:hypothetical protein
MTVKRYHVVGYDPEEYAHPEGDWVKFDDYLALSAKLVSSNEAWRILAREYDALKEKLEEQENLLVIASTAAAQWRTKLAETMVKLEEAEQRWRAAVDAGSMLPRTEHEQPCPGCATASCAKHDAWMR